MIEGIDAARRDLIRTVGAAGLVTASGLISPAMAKGRHKDKERPEEVTPPEDLMREHGVLDRILLIYEAVLRKFSANEDFDPKALTDCAQIVRDFIENYHEKSEENDLFPRFKHAGKLVDLVDTLLNQHQAGRRVTDVILHLGPNLRRSAGDKRQVAQAMPSFITMYRPHAAREDTVLFPALRSVVSAHEFDVMAKDFEEEQLFGEDGFHRIASSRMLPEN